MKKGQSIYSITAHLDLLGFSNHLVLSSYDLRTKIGKAAIERLEILEEAIKHIETEKLAHPEFYPDTFRILRFNDSVILGIDVNEPIMPKIGEPNEKIQYTYEGLERYFRAKNKNVEFSKKFKSHFDNEAVKVAQFMGIVSRIHTFVNDQEYQRHMPGCRTIISSGLRYYFENYKGDPDFYSANFSLANAYIANDLGSKAGLAGNKCFVEDNVAVIASYNIFISRLIGFIKFIPTKINSDPFAGNAGMLSDTPIYKEAKPVGIELFSKKYNFREINATIGTHLQLFPAILEYIEKDTPKEGLFKTILEMFKHDTPTFEEFNAAIKPPEHVADKFPLFLKLNPLDTLINDAFEQLSSH